jgi:DNA-damage-inducible protein J
MDENLTRQADALFSDMGMNMTTAFNIFTRTVVRQGKIPFEIVGDPFNSSVNQAHLLVAAERMTRAGGTVHELIESDRGADD